MYAGIVTMVKIDRGFGFIRMKDQPDIFFHCNDLDGELPFDESLQERRVEFQIQSGGKGPRAASIRPAV